MAGISGIALDILDRMEQQAKAAFYPGTSTKVREKRATLKLSTEELLHDIANMAYVEGDHAEIPKSAARSSAASGCDNGGYSVCRAGTV